MDYFLLEDEPTNTLIVSEPPIQKSFLFSNETNCMILYTAVGVLFLLFFLRNNSRQNRLREKKQLRKYLDTLEETKHSLAFQKIVDQIGEDKESWPVLLVNEIIHLRKEVTDLKVAVSGPC
jgi:hypothetical protein